MAEVTRLSVEDIKRRAKDFNREFEKFFEGIAAPRGNDSEIGGRLVALVKKDGHREGILSTSPIKTASSIETQDIQLESVDE